MSFAPMPQSFDNAELMYVKCAYCGQWLDVKPGKMNLISHSICPDCFKKEILKQDAHQNAIAEGRVDE